MLLSRWMDVFLVPLGRDRYELYSEQPVELDPDADAPSPGIIGRSLQRFSAVLRAAEEREQAREAAGVDETKGWLARIQDRFLAWVVERVAEQRLLWNLRGKTTAVVQHPQDMTFDQVMVLIRRMLQRDYERHRLWLVVDTLGLIASGAVMLVPGPNVLAYYFVFRVVGHWLSMRGAAQGLHHVQWTGRSCPPLGELREVAGLAPGVREARIHDVAARLRLDHLSTFFERVALRHA
jgi:hypothetical protein